MWWVYGWFCLWLEDEYGRVGFAGCVGCGCVLGLLVCVRVVGVLWFTICFLYAF